jgi:hypothetical protein
MMRTTLDIDGPVLRELKQLQKKERKSLGAIVSDLLAEALGRRRAKPVKRPVFAWTTRAMHARVDLADKDALYAALEGTRAIGPKRGGHS